MRVDHAMNTIGAGTGNDTANASPCGSEPQAGLLYFGSQGAEILEWNMRNFDTLLGREVYRAVAETFRYVRDRMQLQGTHVSADYA